jgi:hypothetical protein
MRTRQANPVKSHVGRSHAKGERIVRIHLPLSRRTYAYTCAGFPRLGSLVRVNAPISGTVITPVVGFGRGAYVGPLKRATLLH